MVGKAELLGVGVGVGRAVVLLASKMQNSFYPRRSGDVIMNLMPGWIEENDRCASSSGSMYGYDTQVPLVFYGFGAGPLRVKRRVDMTAVAPTLARMLDIRRPAASEGEVLAEIAGEE